MWLTLADCLDCHDLGFLPLITPACPLIDIGRVIAAGGCGIGYVLLRPFFPIFHELHERIRVVARGVLSLATPPLFYFPCG